MKKSIPWIDFILYGGLALLSLAGVVLTLIVGTELPGYIVAGATATGFVVIAVVVFFRWWNSRPDYYVDPGVSIWNSGIPELTAQAMKTVFEYYIRMLPKIIGDFGMADRYPEVTANALREMLRNARVEWTRKPITLIARFWSVKDKAGLQQGKGVMVHWQGSVKDSALFHELHHMVDEIILKRGPDYKHEDKEWWHLVPELKQRALLLLL